MNEIFYETAANLTEADLSRDVGAFFRSVIGTLNHVLVWHVTWLQRFSKHLIAYHSLEPLKEIAPPTLLFQMGFDPGVTNLLSYLPEESCVV